MTVHPASVNTAMGLWDRGHGQRTNQTKPDKVQSEDGDNTQRYPAHRLRIQGQPEEPLVGSIDLSGIRIRRLKDPVAVSRLSVDFIPPAQTDQSSAGNVLEIVEIHGQEDDCDDENEDVVFAKVEAEEVGQETCCLRERQVRLHEMYR